MSKPLIALTLFISFFFVGCDSGNESEKMVNESNNYRLQIENKDEQIQQQFVVIEELSKRIAEMEVIIADSIANESESFSYEKYNKSKEVTFHQLATTAKKTIVYSNPSASSIELYSINEGKEVRIYLITSNKAIQSWALVDIGYETPLGFCDIKDLNIYDYTTLPQKGILEISGVKLGDHIEVVISQLGYEFKDFTEIDHNAIVYESLGINFVYDYYSQLVNAIICYDKKIELFGYKNNSDITELIEELNLLYSADKQNDSILFTISETEYLYIVYEKMNDEIIMKSFELRNHKFSL